ncbi:mitotic-spindle organizing gamma-tubulin ring associated-domain-containing protein [Powellomyces hirtus]|nr:mitotic-spindle organizing gamma-tubulin ring associated-domain-containing protein [Powellomyces hirtus]
MDPTLHRARETMDILSEISTLLNTGLDRDTLALCVSLCEAGVNPEALAVVIRELRNEAKNLARDGNGNAAKGTLGSGKERDGVERGMRH